MQVWVCQPKLRDDNRYLFYYVGKFGRCYMFHFHRKLLTIETYYTVLEHVDLIGPNNMLTLTSYVKLASSHSLKVICY
jgi:hypothetical protein